MSFTSAQLSRPAVGRSFAPLAAAGLLAVAAVHLIDGPGSLSDVAYIGVLELALVAFSAPIAVMLIIRPVRALWLTVGSVTLLALLAYVASRTVGLPGSTDDIGNWLQTLGLVNVITELAVLAAVAGGLHAAVRQRR
jgi:hypothetical protein